jgi:NAD(P)-dependent dehydrogenase (short-subunit alcohol dehydrogenase family)
LNHESASPLDIGWTRVPIRRKPEYCYICKQEFMTRHFFYDYLCLRCGDLNYHKRRSTVDLQGYRVLVTGARVKIGYAVALRLLRAGAEVIVTSRFPRDTARRYMQEADFSQWGSRLHVYGVDFRSVTSLEQFIQHLYQRYSHIDALINNAAQTVKRPRAFYAHLLPFESTPMAELPAPMQNLLSDSASAIENSPDEALAVSDPSFPAGLIDENGEQVDYRDFNSWVMRVEDVPVSEMIEAHLVNAVAPAILAGQLKHLLQQSPHEMRFILNVSAAEGRFSQFKTAFHPHTNMAKAALNMLTRTIADDYAESRIYVNSVDPGWVSDQIPHTGEMSRLEGLEILPLDMIDAAARVCDPLMKAIESGQAVYGQLWKDYGGVGW